MSKREKIIQRVLEGKKISFEEARSLLAWLGFQERSRGSHHTFAKHPNSVLTITYKKELPKYQMDLLKEVLEKNGY